MIEMDKNVVINKLAQDRGFWAQIKKRIANDDTAEDVLQKTLMKAYQSWDQLRDKQRFYPWIFQIMKNEALKTLMENQKYNYHELCPNTNEAKPPLDNCELRVLLKKTLETENFYTQIEHKAAQILISETISGIPHEIIAKNIAQELSVKMNYVTSLLYRIRCKLNKHLQQNGYENHLRKRKAENVPIEGKTAKNYIS